MMWLAGVFRTLEAPCRPSKAVAQLLLPPDPHHRQLSFDFEAHWGAGT